MKRSVGTATGVATPGSAAETVVATVNCPSLADNPLISGVVIDGVINIVTGLTASAIVVRVRRTNVSGAVVGVAQTVAASASANASLPFSAFDTAPVAGGVYVVTVSVTGQSGAGSIPTCVVTATAA
jgi:hypothetical protein